MHLPVLPLLSRALATVALGFSLSCIAMSQTAQASDISHVAWSRHASIYQVNIRQHTPEGTLQAFARDLPRIRKLGVDILWFMPLQPIGKQERKGGLGSYYSISDYTAVNPEFGTLADAKAMVKEAHRLGFKLILDWVPNHTAWDHPWTRQHKDWYKLNDKGEIFPVTFTEGPEPEYWTDVVALDYRSEALRTAMIDAMKFWLREVDMDGFRCDVASLVPTDFWERARPELDAVKPVFMLAESDKPELHRQAFDMTYSWDLADVFKAVGKGKADARDLKAWLQAENEGTAAKVYPRHAYRMRFTSNHDFNSWHGTDAELYGEAYQPLAVLAFTLPGMPLIYGGQESRLDKRLAFFEKDLVPWKRYELQDFYAELVALKKSNPALANGQYGAPAEALETGNDQVFAFRRQFGSNRVTVAVNLSGIEQSYQLDGASRQVAPWRWFIETRH